MEQMQFNTPVGTASYPHLTNPDTFMNRTSYNCKLVLDTNKDEVTAFVNKINSYVERAKEEARAEVTEALSGLDGNSKNPKTKKKHKELSDKLASLDDDYRTPLTDEYDDNDEPTGNVILYLKSNASFQHKTKGTISLAPKFYDASATPMEARPLIKGGAQIALQGTLLSYNASFGAGVSARINSVQIVSLGGGAVGGDAGFAAHAGGFDASTYDSSQDAETVSDEGVDDEDNMEY
jgi:hypothetical protein